MQATASLKAQVSSILHGKIHRLCAVESARANPIGTRKRRPYSVPQEAADMVAMLGRIEDASREELGEMAAFAASPAVTEKIFKTA